MALDTARKRLSAINHVCSWRGHLHIPDGGPPGAGARQHVAFFVQSITASSPAAAVAGDMGRLIYNGVLDGILSGIGG